MIALLRTYDGHKIFSWNGVTLNAVVAVLSVAMKAALTSAVATCLGQWKWIIFSREECCVLDFEKIDQASRGVGLLRCIHSQSRVVSGVAILDQVQTLTATSRRTAAKLGAFVVLLAIALGPFSQQLIQVKTTMVYSKMQGYPIARSTAYDLGNVTETGPKQRLFGSEEAYHQVTAEIDPSLEAFILYGLFNERSLYQKRADMYCWSRDCRWPSFTTAGICYQCNDITSELTRYDVWALSTPNGSTKGAPMSAYFLPNEAFLANLDGDITATRQGNDTFNYKSAVRGSGASLQMMGFSTGDPNKTVSMGDLKGLIFALSAVQLNWPALMQTASYNYSWPDIPVTASECALHYCGLYVTSQVSNGTLMETTRKLDLVPSPDSYKIVEKELFPSLPQNVSNSLEFDSITSRIARTDLKLQDSRNASKAFIFGADTVKSVSSFFQATFQTSVNLTDRMGPRSVAVSLQSGTFPRGRANIAYYGSWGLPPKGRGLYNPSRRELWQSFDLLAQSMTDAIRNAVPEVGQVVGEFGRQETVYMVQWSWITLHALLIVGGTAFYIATMVSASRAEKAFKCLAWKNSSLAVMSKASQLGSLFEVGDSVKQLERKAELKTASFNSLEGERLNPLGAT
ncbi:hypothetical protein MY3296_007554 [Beauveria thailandica]